MPLIKTQVNTGILETEKRTYPIINKLKTGDRFFLPTYCKIISNKDTESQEIIDGGYEFVYENDGKIKNLYIVDMQGFEQRCIISKEIDGYLFYCALFITWSGENAEKFSKIPENIATDEGLYNYIADMTNKAAYETFRPKDSEESFKELFLKKITAYVKEYGISINEVFIDGYMCEKEKEETDENMELSVEIEKDTEIKEEPIRCKSCGYIPEGKIPKFCPECGAKFE